MSKAILGKKVGMTQLFLDNGNIVPVTVIEAGPCTVVQKKTPETDGYSAIQVGYGAVKEKKINKPTQGHYAKFGVKPSRYLREFRGESDLESGASITVEIFEPGEKVDVTGTSKGKGFQGVVKRYGFHGGKMTHGVMGHRKPQSAGATDPAHIFKGTKRPGHMGHERVTVKRLEVVRVDPEKNLLLVKGAVPGPNGGLITVKGS
jgi:large subunit ribosomal protein L3